VVLRPPGPGGGVGRFRTAGTPSGTGRLRRWSVPAAEVIRVV